MKESAKRTSLHWQLSFSFKSLFDLGADSLYLSVELTLESATNAWVVKEEKCHRAYCDGSVMRYQLVTKKRHMGVADFAAQELSSEIEKGRLSSTPFQKVDGARKVAKQTTTSRGEKLSWRSRFLASWCATQSTQQRSHSM